MKETTPKNILFISYTFPRWKAIGAIRNYNIAKQLLNYFQNIKVITTTNHTFFPKNDFDISIFQIEKTITFDYHTLLHIKKKFFSKKIISNTIVKDKAIRASSIVNFTRKLLNSFPFNALISEGGIFYIVFAYFKALRLSKGCSHIYSSFSPMSDHYVAFLLKLTKPDLFWIADFRDCYSHPDTNPVFFPAFHETLMKAIFRKANIVTTVSYGLKDYLEQFGKEIHVLRNAVDQNQLLQSSIDGTDRDLFRISYTGLLYEGQRDPTILFEAIQKMSKSKDISFIKLCYAGSNTALWNHWIQEYGLEMNNETLGEISHKEAMALQEKSAINLLLSWSLPTLKGIMTGKFYEYLRVRKPILLIINGVQDEEFEQVFDEIACGRVIYNKTTYINETIAFIEKQYNIWRTDFPCNESYSEQHLQKYTWAYQVENLKTKI